MKFLTLIMIGVMGFLVAYAYFAPVNAGAFNPFDIKYPIVELGNCADQQQCKAFCDNADNAVACTNWAEKQGLVSKSEAKKVRAVRVMEEERKKAEDPNYDGEGAMLDDYGPGGCKSPRECDNFCRKLENLEVCLNYSVEKGFMSKTEADKIIAKANKGGPGGCKSPQECDNFCRKPENMKACMQFAVDDGKISQEEADFMVEQAQKFGPPDGGVGGEPGQPGQGGPDQGGGPRRGPGPRGPGGPPSERGKPKIDEEKAKKVLADKGGPGGCKTMDECEKFCGNPDNMETCMNFAAEQGMMPKEEIEKAKKMMKIGGPGGCRGPQECDAFCSKEGNGEICMKFSIDNGLMAPEEIEGMKKQMEIVKKLQDKGGPGGCKGPEECGKYCSDPSHMDECMNFASKSGMMPKEEIERKKNEMRMMQERMNQTEMRQQQFMQEFKGGPGMPFPQDGFMPPRDGQNMPQDRSFEGGMPPFGQPGGPNDGPDRRGPNPSQREYPVQGGPAKGWDPNRQDFQQFGDFGDMEKRLKEGDMKLEDFEKFKKEMENRRQNMPPQGEGRVIMPYRPMDGQGGPGGGQGGFAPQGQPQGQPGQMMPYNPQGRFGQPNESNPSPAPYPVPMQSGQQGDFKPPMPYYRPNESNPSPAPYPAPYQGAPQGGFGQPMPYRPMESNPSPAPMPTPSSPTGGSTQFAPPPMESNPSPAPMPVPTGAPSSFIYPPQSLLGTVLAPFLEILR